MDGPANLKRRLVLDEIIARTLLRRLHNRQGDVDRGQYLVKLAALRLSEHQLVSLAILEMDGDRPFEDCKRDELMLTQSERGQLEKVLATSTSPWRLWRLMTSPQSLRTTRGMY